MCTSVSEWELRINTNRHNNIYKIYTVRPLKATKNRQLWKKKMSIPINSLYSLTWGDYGTSLVSAVQLLRCHGDLVDCTLAAGGRSFPAHKIVLCAASPFLLDLLKVSVSVHCVPTFFIFLIIYINVKSVSAQRNFWNINRAINTTRPLVPSIQAHWFYNQK